MYIIIFNALNFFNLFYFIQEPLATLELSDKFWFTANLVCSCHINIKNHFERFGVFAFLIAVTLWVDWSVMLTEKAVQEHGNLPSGGSEIGTVSCLVWRAKSDTNWRSEMCRLFFLPYPERPNRRFFRVISSIYDVQDGYPWNRRCQGLSMWFSFAPKWLKVSPHPF